MRIEDWWKEDTPKFTHDCTNCKFLGWYAPKPGVVHDLYICIHIDYFPSLKRTGSLIKRFGNEGSAYWSMDLNEIIKLPRDRDHEFISIAVKRAIQAGYITPDMALQMLKSL